MANYSLDRQVLRQLTLLNTAPTVALTTAAQKTDIFALPSKPISQSLITWQATDNAGNLTALTADLLGSIDGVNFFKLDSMAFADTFVAGTASGWVANVGELRYVSANPLLQLQIKLNTITGTSVTFSVMVD